MTNRVIPERDIENLLEQKLIEKKYIFDLGNKNRNVFMQKPKTHEEKYLLKGLSPDYLIYLNNKSTKPNIVIEVKKPNMNLEKTLNQGLDYAHKLNAEIVIIYDGINLKSFYVENKQVLKIDGLEIIDIQTIDIYKKFIEQETSHINLNSTLHIQSKNDLINVFDYANKKLRLAGIQKGIERFTEFSNLLFLKLISEGNEIVNENIPEHIRWGTYKNKSGSELHSYINDVVIPQLESIFNRNQQKSLFSKLLIQDTKYLKQIIEKLDKLELSKIQTDIKGDAFEYFIQKYNSTNKDLGEYFTPRHIVNFLVNIAKPKYTEKIYDPFCGTGGMLISVFNYVYENLKNSRFLNDSTLKDLKENSLFGSEISSTSKVAKMNMILTGDGHTNIKQEDTLKKPIKEKYDVIITNIPFNLSVESSDFYYSLGTQDGNSQCIEHIIKSLKRQPNARAFIIIPEGFLNNSESYNTRKFIIDNNILKGIISLPSGVFLPYTDTKTSILELKSFNSPKVDKVYYFKINNDGYTLTTRRRQLSGINDLDEFLSLGNHLYDNYIDYTDICEETNYSLMYFKYIKIVPNGYISLNKVIKETNFRNQDLYPTQTITNSEFYGVKMGEDFWGDNFISVTSASNKNYKVIHQNHFAYNPSRINVGSLGININERSLAVSSAYLTFKVFNNDFLPDYVYHYLKSNEAMEEIKVRCFGSVRQALRFDDLKQMYIPLLPKDKQKKICDEARKKYDSYIKCKKEIDNFDINSDETLKYP